MDFRQHQHTIPLKVLVVDDSALYRKIVRCLLEEIPGVDVVGTASNGQIALEKIERFEPDLVTLDLEMPLLDGLGVLRHLQDMPNSPGAIMLSAFTSKGAKTTLSAFELGAFDFVLKPTGATPEDSMRQIREQLASKIEGFARSINRQPVANGPATATPSTNPLAFDVPTTLSDPFTPEEIERLTPSNSLINSEQAEPIEVVCIGISTGGPAALGKVLPKIPADFPVPILIVQHMPPIFTKSLANDLNRACALEVQEAVDDQRIGPGQILIAPGGKQMKIHRTKLGLKTIINEDLPERNCRPSVDYLFRSVAHTCGGKALGVIMTGMGDDGMRSCWLLKRFGSPIIAQDEASCVVYGMPRQIVEQGMADIVSPLNKIVDHISLYANRGRLR